ncbi:MAG: 2-C-methyl-D-erythritol 4-phosphate cytidylyltransferase [Gemmatimonadetes bacterium]|nr:2-C-methyl-D-erythritol 4-phosphate cytidylyltransferase [Gemmatimonadota bacterium]
MSAELPAVPDVAKHVVRDIGVVIVAAGAGTRVGGGSGELKQFRWVAGKPMLLHSVQLFQQRDDVAMVVCVLPKQVAGDPPPWLFQSDTERLLVAPGGATRAESVRNGLEDLPGTCRYVLIHDAARPLATAATVERVVAKMRTGRGVVPALPVVDTLKTAGDDGLISATVTRAGLWRAQTPQGFPRDMIIQAHEHAVATGQDGTDDASLCEALGLEVVIVRGAERAMKVTEESDLALLDAWQGVDE